MANDVFANGREISCKAADGKTICAFPDVCFSPPENPATPPGVPVPYPNTGFAKDTTSGSKTVKISKKEVMLKNKSYFKTSVGDEAGCAAKKGVITSKNKGKVYFKAWSMDVKFEGENVDRHLDLTTNNHASDPGDTPPWPYTDSQALAPGGACHKENEEIQKHCDPEKDWKKNCPTPPKHPGRKPKGAAAIDTYKADYAQYISEFDGFAEKCKSNKCINARKCMLVPYKPSSGCCPGQTGDHLIDAASFLEPGKQSRNKRKRIPGWKNYDVNAAPCVCAEGPNQTTATHGQLHVRRGVSALHQGGAKKQWSRQAAAKTGAKALAKTFPSSGCSEACTEAQLNQYHDKAKSSDPEQPLKANASMTADEGARSAARVDMGVPSTSPMGGR